MDCSPKRQLASLPLCKGQCKCRRMPHMRLRLFIRDFMMLLMRRTCPRQIMARELLTPHPLTRCARASRCCMVFLAIWCARRRQISKPDCAAGAQHSASACSTAFTTGAATPASQLRYDRKIEAIAEHIADFSLAGPCLTGTGLLIRHE